MQLAGSWTVCQFEGAAPENSFEGMAPTVPDLEFSRQDFNFDLTSYLCI